MKRIYACICIVAALLATTFYSSSRVESFTGEMSLSLDAAIEAVRKDDTAAARQSLLESAEKCSAMRLKMSAFLRTDDFTELESALRAADGYLELGSTEEAFGEMRRAQIQLKNLDTLARRFI